MNATDPTARLRHELESIRNYLTAAQDVVKAGHMPELTGLDNRIAALCESLQKANVEFQQECLPYLHALIDQLNTCERTMRESQPQLPPVEG